MTKVEKTLARLRELLEADKKAAKFGAVTTDRGPLQWDGEEDLKAGDEVFVLDEEGNRTPAPEGDYMTEDGKTIVVVDGRVAEIRDPEAEVAPEPEAEAPAVEAAEEDAPAAEEAPAAEPEPDYRELYEDAMERIAELEQRLADALAVAEQAEAEAVQLKAQPAARPAHEEVKASNAAAKTGVKGLDRLAALMSK